MSSHEQAMVSLLSNFALSRSTVPHPVCALFEGGSYLESDSSDRSGGEELVTAGGPVEAKWAVEGETWKCLRRNILGLAGLRRWGGDRTKDSKCKCCISNEWKGFSGWTMDLQVLLVLIDGSQRPAADYVLPVTTVHHQLQPINAPPYTFVQALFNHEYPVIFSILLGKVSIGTLGFAFSREKKWRLRRWDEQEQQQQSHGAVDQPNTNIAEDKSGDVPNGQLCVICPCGPPDVAQETHGG
ncbi:hypothetical protein ACJRO7_020545 [Eucalyptus globulus]|uniref:Uncharacterized protein n=1 Tax=Eucalyptus globulus TaxID=34317 RepID=A0ABD3KLU5_EUCGL